jgi:hypothetical protein
MRSIFLSYLENQQSLRVVVGSFYEWLYGFYPNNRTSIFQIISVYTGDYSMFDIHDFYGTPYFSGSSHLLFLGLPVLHRKTTRTSTGIS